jgi:Ca2+-binding RTX toxin-like protein
LTFAIEDPSVLQTLEDGTTIVDVERIHFIGGNGADHITGGALDDRLSGGSGANILNGGGGADRLFTYSGDDFLDGGDGIDTIVIFRRSDSAPVAFVMEAPENATILPSGATIQNIERLEYIGGLGDDHLTGGRFDDLLVGNEGDDVLIGGDGDDFLTGGTGADILDGGAGIDTATIGGGNFDLTEPIVEYELADGTILRGIEAINYSGGQGNDHIIGGAFADTFKWWRR